MQQADRPPTTYDGVLESRASSFFRWAFSGEHSLEKLRVLSVSYCKEVNSFEEINLLHQNKRDLVILDSVSLLLNKLAPQAWTLLSIGLGGYVVGRSAEKVVGRLRM